MPAHRRNISREIRGARNTGVKKVILEVSGTRLNMEKRNSVNSSTGQGPNVPIKRRRIGRPAKVAPDSLEMIKKNFASQASGECGMVLTMGQGPTGQLGLGPDTFDRLFPRVVKMTNGDNLTDIIAVQAGGMHSLCLTTGGEVYSYGCNDEGALGRFTSDEDDCFMPGLVENLKDHKIVQISAGDSHSIFLTDEGLVFATGTFRDANGIIGLVSPKTVEKTPVQMKIPSNKRIRKISSGLDHVVCLTFGGQLVTAGCADQGQLGRVSLRQCQHGGRKGMEYLLIPSYVNVSHSMLFSDIWTGQYNTYAKVLDSSSLIYTCGLNNFNQLGLEDIRSRYSLILSASFRTSDGVEIKHISGGQHHSLAMDANKRIYSIGRPEYGRLGLGDCDDVMVTPTKIVNIKNASCISADTSVSFAIVDGGVYAWGMGSNGQLGQKEDNDLLVPTKVLGKQLTDRKALAVSAGGQHVIILAK